MEDMDIVLGTPPHGRNSLRLSSSILIGPGCSTGARYWNASGAIFRALVKLTVALHRALGDSNNFERRRHREEVLQRLE
jgi:hypothetical protein